jgi:TolA-binding protein
LDRLNSLCVTVSAATACLHEVVWGLGPIGEVAVETAGTSFQELEVIIEDLTDQVQDLEFENKQIVASSQAHVEELEDELEQLRDSLEETEFDHKQFRKQTLDHVAEVWAGCCASR